MAPRIAFFSGGTALAALSRYMASIDFSSLHIISTFDSGGSTAELRRKFAMPAIGDLRNRLIALADPELAESVCSFCSLRLDQNETNETLKKQLNDFASPLSSHWKKMPLSSAHSLCAALRYFLNFLTEDFNLAGASLGNLMLAGLYLKRGRLLEPPLAVFGRILNIKGIVVPVTEISAHLACELEDGTYMVGQHLFNQRLPYLKKKVFLTVHESAEHFSEKPVYCHPRFYPQAGEYLKKADLVCYPPGSFYSSVLSNLLVKDVGKTIAGISAAKVFVPNSGEDAELQGLDIASQAELVIKTLSADMPCEDNRKFLQYVLVDREHGRYPKGIDMQIIARLEKMGLKLVDKNMINADCPERHEPKLLFNALMEMTDR